MLPENILTITTPHWPPGCSSFKSKQSNLLIFISHIKKRVNVLPVPLILNQVVLNNSSRHIDGNSCTSVCTASGDLHTVHRQIFLRNTSDSSKISRPVAGSSPGAGDRGLGWPMQTETALQGEEAYRKVFLQHRPLILALFVPWHRSTVLYIFTFYGAIHI